MGWKYGKPIKEKLMTLEEPGKMLPFDADRGLVDEVMVQCDIGALVESVKGKNENAAIEELEAFGKELMKLTIELADSRFIDRTGEMVERVAEQTGVSFPHRFERYVELAILASRPTDRWNITKATTRELVLQVSSCTLNKAMAEDGLALPCKAMCLASFEVAAARTGDKLNMEMSKAITKDGICEFTFSLRSQEK
ncbi:MAG: hypothetical protein RI591_04955 [Dehalococcoidia bacterium]|nr:hypothetical protein [Dehalococcoidia bacterium]